MIWLGIVSVILGYYCHVSILVQADQLVIDPLSIFIDDNLNRFCWKPIGNSNSVQMIKVYLKKKTVVEEWKVFEDEQFDKGTLCISEANISNQYVIFLTMTKSASSPIIMKFTVYFQYPLGPALEIIRYQSVQRGLHFELNTEFAGLDSSIGPLCQVILISQSKGIKRFQFFVIKSGTEDVSKKFLEVEAGSSFTVYYTCDMASIFKTSTKFVVINGDHNYDASVSDLQPIIQAPFRRFLKVIWRHKIDRKRYDVVIYLKTAKKEYTCVKVFRIFVILPKNPGISIPSLHPNCQGVVPIEDMVYSQVFNDGSLKVVLDMNQYLWIYKEYKLAIFWEVSSGTIMDNYLHFTPLPNKNIGYVIKNSVNIKWDKYDEIINNVSRKHQTVIGRNTESSYKDLTLSSCSCTSVEIMSSVTSSNVLSIPFDQINRNTSAIHLWKTKKIPMNLYPYFYVMYYTSIRDNDLIELMQVHIPREQSFIINKVLLQPNNQLLNFNISWEFQNYPTTIMPAMFAVIVADETKDKCVGLYILYCRTCNELYLKNTKINAEGKLKYWKKNCTKIKELYNQYDVIDSSVGFITDKLVTDNIYKAQVFTFIEHNDYKSGWSKTSHLIQSFFMKYDNFIIGIIVVTVILSFLVFCFMCCKYLTRDPVVAKEVDQVSENDNMYDQDDHV